MCQSTMLLIFLDHLDLERHVMCFMLYRSDRNSLEVTSMHNDGTQETAALFVYSKSDSLYVDRMFTMQI